MFGFGRSYREFMPRKGCNEGVHSFEAIYDTKLASDDPMVLIALDSHDRQVRTYVRHVCIGCGAVVERETE